MLFAQLLDSRWFTCPIRVVYPDWRSNIYVERDKSKVCVLDNGLEVKECIQECKLSLLIPTLGAVTVSWNEGLSRCTVGTGTLAVIFVRALLTFFELCQARILTRACGKRIPRTPCCLRMGAVFWMDRIRASSPSSPLLKNRMVMCGVRTLNSPCGCNTWCLGGMYVLPPVRC